MDLNHIYEFIALAKHRNFHVAADELGISQPTLSNHIKKLESELNISLFDRNTRNIELNEFGEAFYPYAISLTELYNSSVQAINAKHHSSNVVLTVAIEPQYEIGSVLQLFSDYRKSHPDIIIEFANASDSHAYSFLRSGRCNLAILPQAVAQDKDFNTITLREEHAVALVHKKHHLADRTCLKLEDLVDERLFIPPVRLVLYRMLEAAYHEVGYELDPSCMGVTELMGMLLTQQGQGVMIMSDYAAKKFADASLRIIDICPRIKWYVNMLYTNVHFSPEGRNLLNYIQSSLQKGTDALSYPQEG